MPAPTLSPKEEIILRILVDQGPLYGLEIVDASDGELKRGTVYVTLARMEDKGFLNVLAPPRGESTPGLPRPRYRISALGQRMLDAVDLIKGKTVLA
ncbi:MAG: helix-turn-helix transcriptional regulator [Polyangiaceae bacterium]